MANKSWPSEKRKAEYLQKINIADGHPLMTMKTYCSADDNIYFKKTVVRIPNTGCNDYMEQNDDQRVHSWGANNHLKNSGKSDGAVHEIPDHIIEAAQKEKYTNRSVGVILRCNKVRNEEN